MSWRKGIRSVRSDVLHRGKHCYQVSEMTMWRKKVGRERGKRAERETSTEAAVVVVKKRRGSEGWASEWLTHSLTRPWELVEGPEPESWS